MDFKYDPLPFAYPQGIRQYVGGGRCLSATHEAQASVRIMPFCCCMGEAAGRAMALAYKNHAGTREIDIPELQKQLGL